MNAHAEPQASRQAPPARNAPMPKHGAGQRVGSGPQALQLRALRTLTDGGAGVAQLERLNALANAPRANRTGLPDQLKTGVENLSGYALDDVKVHYNSGRPAQLQAHAYAQGTDIHLAPGQEHHLPHEAWHVVQQKQGRVKATTQLKDMVDINDDTQLEAEADAMGALALRGDAAMPDSAPAPLGATASPARPVAQRAIHLATKIAAAPAIARLKENALYQDLNARASIYIKSSAAESDMKVRNSLDREFMQSVPGVLHPANINYIININNDILDQQGLEIRPERTHPIMGGLSTASASMARALYEQAVMMPNIHTNPNQPVPIFDIGNSKPSLFSPGSFNTPKLRDYQDPLAMPLSFHSDRLSVDTVILHELGHVEQHLNTRKLYMGPAIGNVTQAHMPPLPPNMVADTTLAYHGKTLRAPIWTELVDMHNTMRHWIEPYKSFNINRNGDDTLNNDADALQDLGMVIANKAMVWIEYDNITHTEHPEARSRGEAIRHLHGTEASVPGAGIPGMAALASANTLHMPADLREVGGQMTDNAHRLTAGIIADATRYVALHDRLRLSRG